MTAVPAHDTDLAGYLDGLRQEVDAALVRLLDAMGAPPVLDQAMRYALLGSGKRLRPCLTLAAAEAAGARLSIAPETARALALPGACAVEMIHTYSLVHDDLPAMDDDALRRGRPTSHVVYGDGLAILVGDALHTEAFRVLATDPSPALPPGATGAPADRRLRAVDALATAAGPRGMAGGQALDLAAAGQVREQPATAMDGDMLADMHARKTGALIRAATTLGAILAGAGDDVVRAVDAYARDLGLAFQIVDDVLDVEGSAEALGKTAGKDAAAGKPTYPSLYGLDGSRRLAITCVERARSALAAAALGGRLADIADWSLTRRS